MRPVRLRLLFKELALLRIELTLVHLGGSVNSLILVGFKIEDGTLVSLTILELLGEVAD